MSDTLAVVGAGNVGTTLAHLFTKAGLQLGSVASRSARSAELLVASVGQGSATEDLGDLQPAALLLVSTPDGAIAATAEALRQAGVVRPATIVFHCSGATSSEVLAPLRDAGARIASVHPVKTFTDPVRDAESFPGTWCGVEGDDAATVRLSEIFTGFGATCFPVESGAKALYHAGAVFACNYLAVLVEMGCRAYEAAGVPRETSTRILGPIMRATVENCLKLGPGRALTGPVARGDGDVVATQMRALGERDPRAEALYRQLGLVAVELSRQKGLAPEEALAELETMLTQEAGPCTRSVPRD